MMKKQKVFLVAACAFFAGALITGCIVAALVSGIGNYAFVDRNEYKSMSGFYEKYKDLAAVDESINMYYYEDTSKIDKVDAACKGLVSALDDPYSAYMTKKEYENFEASTTGSYSGVGIVFSKDEDGHFVILSVYEGTPAASSDIKAGDYILKVDGKSYKDQDVLAANIRGKEGTTVKIEYEHEGKKKTVELKRAKIKIQSISSKVINKDIGYIAITEFISSTSDDFDKALKDLENKGCKKLIIDLRDNGGGLVNQAVNIADHFIDTGYITCTVDKNGQKQELKAHAGKTDMPMVVLVNENSASSSEILSGALKDNGYKLIGQKTFGKGIIQSSMLLEDGSAVKLTVAQYLTPSGKTVHKKGIEPDYKVKNTKDHDEQLDKAIELLK